MVCIKSGPPPGRREPGGRGQSMRTHLDSFCSPAPQWAGRRGLVGTGTQAVQEKPQLRSPGGASRLPLETLEALSPYW